MGSGWGGWGRGLEWGRRGSGRRGSGRRGWNWFRRGSSQGVGEVRGVRGVGVEGVGGVWVKVRVGTGVTCRVGVRAWGSGRLGELGLAREIGIMGVGLGSEGWGS